MSFLRHRQRVITALFPHQANKTHLIPKRSRSPKLLAVDFKTTSTTLTFDRDVTGGTAVGWAMEVDGAPVAVTTVLNGGTDDIIIVSYAIQTVTDPARVTYDGTGTAWLTSKGAPLKTIDESGVIA